MKDNDTPARRPDYLLEKVDSDFRLLNRTHGTAIYINDTAALIWELCDGRRNVGEMKSMLQSAYPDAAEAIDADVREAVSLLLEHQALTLEGPAMSS